jgi:hypothetical protein
MTDILLNTSFLKNADVKLLLEEKSLTKLAVNSEGYLTRKNLWNCFTYSLGWKKTETDKKVALVIIAILEKIKDLPEIQSRKANSNKDLDLSLFDKTVRTLFFERFNQINKNLLKPNDFNFITKEVQNYLDPAIEQLRQKKEEDKSLKGNLDHKLERKIAKAKLAIRLGIGPKANKGATGTIIIKGINGKSLGVFKAGNQHAGLIVRLKNLLKKTFFGQLHYLSNKDLAQAQAEVAAYLVDQFFNFHLSPSSKMTQLLGKEGVFQLFLKDYAEAKQVLNQIDSKENFEEGELYFFQLMDVFDYLIGNLDRHEENWFIKLLKDTLIIEDIKGIDNANSFPRKNPTWLTKFILKNQYKWKNLKLAKPVFCPKVRQFINKSLNENKVTLFLNKLNETLPGFLDEKMKILFLKRVEVLNKLATDPTSSPARLGQYVTDKEIDTLLSS